MSNSDTDDDCGDDDDSLIDRLRGCTRNEDSGVKERD